MSKVVVINHLKLDGVMQSPGRAEEDTRDGFTHRRLVEPNADDQVVAATCTRTVRRSGSPRALACASGRAGQSR
jgi:hypothetical protein